MKWEKIVYMKIKKVGQKFVPLLTSLRPGRTIAKGAPTLDGMPDMARPMWCEQLYRVDVWSAQRHLRALSAQNALRFDS